MPEDTIVEDVEESSVVAEAPSSKSPSTRLRVSSVNSEARQSLRASLNSRESKAIAEEPADCLGRRVTQRSSSVYNNSLDESPDEADEVAAEDDTSTWAHECLRLTHEPIREDLLAMQEALHHISDDRPAPWRVASFFRFFDSFCELCKQQSNAGL